MDKQIKDFNELISNAAEYLESQLFYSIKTVDNLVEIRDILGNVSIQTTEIFARADSRQKREALKKNTLM